jgi:hypothetical protein
MTNNAWHISVSGTGQTLQTVGGGVLSRIVVNNAGGAAGSTVTVYDSASATGTILAVLHCDTTASQGTYEYGIPLQNGLTIVNANPATDMTVVVSPPPINPHAPVI